MIAPGLGDRTWLTQLGWPRKISSAGRIFPGTIKPPEITPPPAHRTAARRSRDYSWV